VFIKAHLSCGHTWYITTGKGWAWADGMENQHVTNLTSLTSFINLSIRNYFKKCERFIIAEKLSSNYFSKDKIHWCKRWERSGFFWKKQQCEEKEDLFFCQPKSFFFASGIFLRPCHQSSFCNIQILIVKKVVLVKKIDHVCLIFHLKKRVTKNSSSKKVINCRYNSIKSCIST